MVLYIYILVLISLQNGQGYVFTSKFEKEDVYCLFDRTLIIDVNKIRINFFDFRNNHSSMLPIKSASQKIANYEYWDPSRRATVFVPSFRSNSKGVACKWIKDSFSNAPDKYLVIIDYSAYAKKLNAKGVEHSIPFGFYIGEATALFLHNLYKDKLSAKKIHLVGHGFGGHIVGYIGDVYKDKTGELIGRITSIDPIKTCFDEGTEEHIRKGKADYVEVYHCSSKCSDKTLGNADIFVNKHLENQPGCHDGVEIGSMKNVSADWCSHYYCLKMWSDTILYPDRYKGCAAEAFIGGVCHGNEGGLAGYHNPGNVVGVLYATTVERRKTEL